MHYDGRKNIVDIDEDEKTVYFETWKPKKISGTKIGAILGYSQFSSEFKVACEIAGIYPGDGPNRYIDAGNILEPVLRNYLGKSCTKMLSEPLNLSPDSRANVEKPVEGNECGYDHFHDNKLFGGLVDGYIMVDGKRAAILEIKTSHDIDKWKDDDGNVTIVPMSYILQACLYAELSNLDKVVFLVGFLTESEVSRPNNWAPSEENTYIIAMDKIDMKPYMDKAESWYNEYIKNGYTPQWDEERDRDVLKYITVKPKK